VTEVAAHRFDILVAATRQAEHDGLVLLHRRSHLHHLCEAVGAFERRDDALEAGANLEGLQRLVVGDGRVLCPTCCSDAIGSAAE